MTSESTQFKKWPVLAAGILGAFCVMIILLITSVEAVAYWTPGVAFRAKCKMFSRHLQKPILKTEKGRFKGL